MMNIDELNGHRRLAPARRWKDYLPLFIFTVYFILLCVALPFCVYDLQRSHANAKVKAGFVGGIFVMAAIPLSLYGIIGHIMNYTQPSIQIYQVRILWMVPIYALDAWLALKFPYAAIYLDTLRECYEAYAIYNFMMMILEYLNSQHNNDFELYFINRDFQQSVKNIIPFCCLPRIKRKDFVNLCKHGTLQYVPVRLCTTVIAFLCQIFDKYGEGDFNFKTSWSYLVIFNNVSQILAMYFLFLFYHATKEELKDFKPVWKFACIKSVVFATFWQGVLIAILVKFNIIKSDTWPYYKNVEEASKSLQDFIVCIEMFVAAILHCIAFPFNIYRRRLIVEREIERRRLMEPDISYLTNELNRTKGNDYNQLAARTRSRCFGNFFQMFDVSDIRRDMREHAKFVGIMMRRSTAINNSSIISTSHANQQQDRPLLDNEESDQQINTDEGENDNDEINDEILFSQFPRLKHANSSSMTHNLDVQQDHLPDHKEKEDVSEKSPLLSVTSERLTNNYS